MLGGSAKRRGVSRLGTPEHVNSIIPRQRLHTPVEKSIVMKFLPRVGVKSVEIMHQLLKKRIGGYPSG